MAPLHCHVSVDIEDGYSDDPDAVADYVAQLAIAGINIEDSTDGKLIDPALAAAKVTAIKQRNPGLFINARVDTYWLHEDADTAATIERALHYVDAEADGIFVPAANDRAELTELTSNITRPLNTLPVPGLTLAGLGELGVARVSTGSAPYRAASYAAAQVARAVRDGQPLPPSAPYEALQERLIAYENHADTNVISPLPRKEVNDANSAHDDRQPAGRADPGR